MEKYIKDGNVAILVSGGFGAGWSTWNSIEWALDKRIVEKVLELEAMEFDGDIEKEMESFMESIGYKGYCGGADGLYIEWVSEGDSFKINEYDGRESLEYGYSNFYTA